MEYDFSPAALFHAEERPVFVGFADMPPFEAHHTGFSLANAWLLAGMAHLAYYDAGHLGPELQRVGFRLVACFSGDSTQGYLATDGRAAFLVFRGTEPDELEDIETDLAFLPVPFAGGTSVHEGFRKALEEVWDDQVSAQAEALQSQGMPVWYAGHSLGAAIATLACTRSRPASCFTFGSPRVGDAAFTRLLDGVPVHRVVNCTDLVATIPPPALGYEHVGEEHFITAGGEVLTDPGRWRVLRHKATGLIRYAARLPWLRRDLVDARSLADHAIVNYTAGIWRAWRRRQPSSHGMEPRPGHE